MSAVLEGRVALVMGGGQGVGQGIARAIASGGATVVVAQRGMARGEEEVAYLRKHYGKDVIFIAVEVTRPADVEKMVKTTVNRFGRLDILVNNAGASFPKRIENHTDEEMAAAFDLNYWAVFRAMRAAFPIMKRSATAESSTSAP